MSELQLFVPHGTNRSGVVNPQRTINLLPMVDPSGSPKVALYSHYGCIDLATVGSGPIRGIIELNNILYVVSRNKLYTVDADNTVTERGTLLTHGLPVSMETNGVQVMIVDGNGYVYDINATTFTQISDYDFISTGATTLTYLNGYAIYGIPDSQEFGWTNLDNFSSVDALDYAASESQPDILIRPFADHGVLWLFGTKSFDVFANVGGTAIFSRINNASGVIGIAGAYAICAQDSSVFWLGNDGVFYRNEGWNPKKVSTEQVDIDVARMSDFSDCEMFAFDMEGHRFVAATFPVANQCWIYDVATNLWVERKTGNDRWLGRYSVKRGTQTIIGDKTAGKLYELRSDAFDDAGTAIHWEHTTPMIGDGITMAVHNQLQVKMEMGDVPVTGTGSTPVVSLTWADSYPRFAERVRMELGSIGEYDYVAKIGPLGSSKRRCYKISGSSPVKTVITGLDGDIS